MGGNIMEITKAIGTFLQWEKWYWYGLMKGIYHRKLRKSFLDLFLKLHKGIRVAILSQTVKTFPQRYHPGNPWKVSYEPTATTSLRDSSFDSAKCNKINDRKHKKAFLRGTSRNRWVCSMPYSTRLLCYFAKCTTSVSFFFSIDT